MMQVNSLPRANKETKDGYIKAVYYGAQAKSTPIFVPAKEITKIIEKEGSSATLTLKTEEGIVTAMVQDIQYHPVKYFVNHVDFYVLEKGQKAHVKIQLNFIGESPAVKTGGVLVKVMHDLSVEGDPSKLPSSLDVDISSLVNGDSVITAGDIRLPSGVTLYHMLSGEIIASISGATEVTDEVAKVDLSAIEVEKKGKKEEEEA
jgi:large subunit ribosomal protein L25